MIQATKRSQEREMKMTPGYFDTGGTIRTTKSPTSVDVKPVSRLEWPSSSTITTVSVQRCGSSYLLYTALNQSRDPLSLLWSLHLNDGSPNKSRTPTDSKESSHTLSSPSSSSSFTSNDRNESRDGDKCPHGTETTNNSNNTQNEDTKEANKSDAFLDLTTLSTAQLHQLTYYEILGNIPIYSNADQIRRAFYKACLKYHPDKEDNSSNNTSNNLKEQDPVFLKVKEAFDVLSNPSKRKAYDSTSIPFDDSLPSVSDIHSDADFYTLFGSCFERNLRFAVEYDPDPTTQIQNTTTSGKHKQKNSNTTSKHKIQSLGDDTTPIDQVYAFYDFWTKFESWRDFTLIASEELKHDTDMAQDRYEKRYMEKEIKKLASKYKMNEMNRIMKLVERAKAHDPRIRRVKLQAQEEKLQLERELQRKMEQEKLMQEMIQRDLAEKQLQEQEEKKRLKLEKEEKKLTLRLARQKIRKLLQCAYELEQKGYDKNRQDQLEMEKEVEQQMKSSHQKIVSTTWSNREQFNEDVDILCAQLDATVLNEFASSLIEETITWCTKSIPIHHATRQQENEQSINHRNQTDTNISSATPVSDIDHCISILQSMSVVVISQNLKRIRSHASGLREESIIKQKEDKLTKEEEAKQQIDENAVRLQKDTKTVSCTAPNRPWSKEELSALAKAVKKYPPGSGTNRWDTIALYVNNLCNNISKNKSVHVNMNTTDEISVTARTREECIDKFNQVANSSKIGTSVVNVTSSSSSNAHTDSLPSSSHTSTVDGVHEAPSGIGCDIVSSSVSNSWSEEQDKELQSGLAKYPASMDKNERWTCIAKGVTGKSKKECVERFKAIREALLLAKKK